MRYSTVCSPLLQTLEGAIEMVSISNRDWTDFVAEVRSRLDVIDANIQNAKQANDLQYKQIREDFDELKKELTGQNSGSLTSRVRSLEDSRTKMNGVQLGLSMAFSVLTGAMAWFFGHSGMHLTWNDISLKFYALIENVSGFFGRRS